MIGLCFTTFQAGANKVSRLDTHEVLLYFTGFDEMIWSIGS
jgi:hypothetical protein